MPSIGNIETMAKDLLVKNELYKVPVDIEELAKKLEIQLEYGRLKGEEFAGVLVIKNGKAVIGLNRDTQINRQRFTIAHEIGHHQLHFDERHLFIDERITFTRNQKSDPRELEANAFAAALLMPEPLVKEKIVELDFLQLGESEIQRLAKIFRVSPIAMTYRLVNLRILESSF